MKAIDFAMRLMRACLNNPTSLMENAVLFAIAAGLDHKDDIARELRHNPGAVSTCLHRLAKGDYIACTTWHEDGSPLYRLTTGGKAYLTHFFNFKQH